MRFERKQRPPLQRRYQDYKPFLRQDFLRRCSYCLISEAHFGGQRNFHVDHYKPKGQFPGLVREYANLYYACGLCNTFKGEHWPSKQVQQAGFRFVDPCEEDSYSVHFEVNQNDGSLKSLTLRGQYTEYHLRLNRRQLQTYRQWLVEIRVKWAELRDLLDAANIPPSVLEQARSLLTKIESSCLEPPTYEVEDLLR